MDKPLPKIGGITIERVPKQGTELIRNDLPGPSVHKQTANVSPVINNLQGNDAVKDRRGEQLYETDAFAKDWRSVSGNEKSNMETREEGLGLEEQLMTTDVGSKSPIFLSSEDDGAEYQHGDYEGEEGNDLEASEEEYEMDDEPQPSQMKQFLPPGVTFERKKTNVTAAVRPNIQLPPGIQIEKRKKVDVKPIPNLPNEIRHPLINPQVRPRGTLRQVRPQRNANLLGTFQGLPTARAPPVRAVRPRANFSPKMMISDFLEQRMQIGNSVGLNAPRFQGVPRSPVVRPPRMQRVPRMPFKPNPIQSLMQNLPKPPSGHGNVRPPVKTLPTGIQLPPGISVQPRVVDVDDSDADDDQPQSSQSLLKLPPGINIERKKVERIERVKPLMAHDVSKAFSNVQPPSGASFDKALGKARSSSIYLPPGISLEKKMPPMVEPQDLEDFDEDEPELDEEDDLDEFDEDQVEEGFDPDIETHTREKLVKEVSSAEGPQPSESGDDVDETPSDELNEMEDLPGEKSGTDSDEVKSPEVQLPSGINMEMRQFNNEATKDATEEDYPDEEMAEEEEEGEDEFNEGDISEDKFSEEQQPIDAMDSSGCQEEESSTIKDNGLANDEQSLAEEVLRQEEMPDAKNEQPVDPEATHMEEEEETEQMDEGEAQPAENRELDEKSEEIDFDSLISSPLLGSNKLLTSENDGSEQIEIKQEYEEKDVMQNLVEMMTKGEIEGEIEDDKEEDDDEKKCDKRKAENAEGEEEEDGSTKCKKEKTEDDEQEGENEDSGPIDKTKVSSTHLRKNIREVMDETKLDETTLAAQRQEAERLKRLQEQQRFLREVQRQIQMSKNAQKSQNQSQVLSMLKGNTETSILKKSSAPPIALASTSTQSSNHVLLKMGNGQQTCLSDKMRELLKTSGRSTPDEQATRTLLKQGMLSSSVTIAPIKREPIEDDGKKKKKDVVTLSSDSDDDCIVLSEEEVESEPEEDPTNSGMHTTDKYNIPDDQGRVLVNTGHPPEEADVFLAPQIARVIKPHQIGGIRFLYDNIIESTERYDSSAGFGCILAHSMGLGKTLQIVSFSDIFFRHTSGKKILCIMPINTIQNWQAEYNMWLPKENPSGGDIRCREFNIYIVNESSKNIHARGKVILEWHAKGGVLLMGYELFRQLSLRKPVKSKRKRPDDIEIERNRVLVEQIYCALVKPGPDLVICDEGHRIKNSHATTSQALKNIRTRRRVVLTGYPLQNNLLEYWCMVDFVRPNYLGSKTEFSNMFERPIQNGQCIDSTPQDKRLMRYRAHVLHSLLEGFVQRRSHAVLQEVLPQKEEYVLLLRFTSFQRKLYDTFMNEVVRTVAVPNPLKAFAVCCKIWNHPDVLFNFLKKKGEQRDLELEEPLPPSVGPPRFPMELGFGAPMASNFPANQPWPKKGPGSRGGKIRQKKGANAVNAPPQQQVGEKTTTEPLPSINQFPLQTPGFRGMSDTPGFSASTSSSNYQQGSYFPQQQQQHQQFPQQNDNYNFQRGFDNTFEETNEQQMFGSNQKMFNSDINMFGNNQQKLYGGGSSHKGFGNEQKSFKGGDFASNFGTDMGSNNYYRGQDQFSHSGSLNSSSFNNTNSSMNPQQYYQPNELSTSSGFDYNQSTTDPAHDFPHISGFSESGFESSNYGSTGGEFQQQQQQQQPPQQQQQNFWGNNWPSTSQGGYSGGSSGDEFISPSKFPSFEGEKKEQFEKGNCEFGTNFPGAAGGVPFKTDTNIDGMDEKAHPTQIPATVTASTGVKPETDVKRVDKKEDIRMDPPKKEDVPHDWASELFKNYVTGVVENSSKMEVFFLILSQSILRQDRILVFSQSLLTLDLIEEYLQKRCVPGREEVWGKNRNYFRLDGSTPALEREKLINEFNINPQVHIFLVSTRAGSLGINLVGANRVVVFDASWNPCHDTQAVCRVYRYGQQKPCYVYRLVMDSCLEKKIYDRQINKQGMADRVVDELNPDAHLSIKEVTNLCWDDQEETSVKDFSNLRDKYHDDIVKMMLMNHSQLLSKAPFQHESLLIDRKEKKLSQAEKRLAKRSYELEKQAANQPRNLYQLFPNSGGMRNLSKPIASVKPMQSERFGAMPSRSKWIPAEVWQKQGMSAQEMTLPLDVVIPTNSPDKTSIVLKAGQRVMVLKSPKGIYMQLETGKIIAIRTAFKVGQGGEKVDEKKTNPITTALKNNPSVTITAKSSLLARAGKTTPFFKPSSLDKKAAAVNMAASKGRIAVNNKNRPIPQNLRKTVMVPPKDKISLLSKKQEVFSTDIKSNATEISAEIGKDILETESMGADDNLFVRDNKIDETERRLSEKTQVSTAGSTSAFDLTTSEFSGVGEADTNSPSVVANNPNLSDLEFPLHDDFSGIHSTVLAASETTAGSCPPASAGAQLPMSGNMLGSTSLPSDDMLGSNASSSMPSSLMPQSTQSSSSSLSSAPTVPDMGSWGNQSSEIPRDIAKESLDSLSSLAMTKEVPVTQPTSSMNTQHLQKPAAPPDPSFRHTFPTETKETPEVKKEEGAPSPWPKQTYPMDPYGNYYPGYPGYYGPMPGYESYPYARGYPPHMPIKTEPKDGTPPPAAVPPPPAAAPLYPPYPNPYPYPYNYPHFPPQAQPPVPAPASTASPAKHPDPPDTATFVPPYTPRPPYPAPTPAPGFFPNYPPYRPFHDPNYPYGNYNPYMPHPGGYGYPMQNPHHMPPHGTDGGTPAAPPPSDTNN